MAATSHQPVGDLPQSALSARMRRLQTGDVIDGRNLPIIEALKDQIAAALQNEVVETRFEWLSI